MAARVKRAIMVSRNTDSVATGSTMCHATSWIWRQP